uniref:Secreted protein n=1 Tax=Steinernema glaseri TaxID=37863 RepID=A0A1I7YNW1_9BILA
MASWASTLAALALVCFQPTFALDECECDAESNEANFSHEELFWFIQSMVVTLFFVMTLVIYKNVTAEEADVNDDKEKKEN